MPPERACPHAAEEARRQAPAPARRCAEADRTRTAGSNRQQPHLRRQARRTRRQPAPGSYTASAQPAPARHRTPGTEDIRAAESEHRRRRRHGLRSPAEALLEAAERSRRQAARRSRTLAACCRKRRADASRSRRGGVLGNGAVRDHGPPIVPTSTSTPCASTGRGGSSPAAPSPPRPGRSLACSDRWRGALFARRDPSLSNRP